MDSQFRCPLVRSLRARDWRTVVRRRGRREGVVLLGSTYRARAFAIARSCTRGELHFRKRFTTRLSYYSTGGRGACHLLRLDASASIGRVKHMTKLQTLTSIIS